jgi:hypothetical protein
MSNITSSSRVGGSYTSTGSVNRKSTVAKRDDEFIDQINAVEPALAYNGLDQDEESKGKNQQQKNQENQEEKQFNSQNVVVSNVYEAQQADDLYIQNHQASRQIDVYDLNNDVIFEHLSDEDEALVLLFTAIEIDNNFQTAKELAYNIISKINKTDSKKASQILTNWKNTYKNCKYTQNLTL